MEEIYLTIVAIIAGIIILTFTFAIIILLKRIPGNRLHKKFQQMGTLIGKPYQEIEKVVGSPNSASRSVTADGTNVIIRQWIRVGYHIVLIFNEYNICLGISDETVTDQTVI